jgi:hypothetical protein
MCPKKHIDTLNVHNSHKIRDRIVFFTFKITDVQNVHHQQQCIVDDKVQVGRRSVLLLMEQRHIKFQFHASGLAVYVVLRCKQHSLEHPTGKSLIGVRSGELGGYSIFSVFQ